MLSYRHAFHAGNHADVLKHIVQIHCLRYLQRKQKPLLYLDTHAGAGVYDLKSDHAAKNAEFRGGIERLMALDTPEEAVQNLLTVVGRLNGSDGLRFYPGSARIGVDLLRQQDRAELCELHPGDYRRLSDQFEAKRQVTVYRQDGYHRAVRALPPQSRRALVLTDPPYELKTDYRDCIICLQKMHRKFATGLYLLWYPVVDRDRVRQMESALRQSQIRDIVQIELNVTEDTEGHGMTGSGLFVINPPWTFLNEMKPVLNQLLDALCEKKSHGNAVLRQLVGE